jgi:hypothetical protein
MKFFPKNARSYYKPIKRKRAAIANHQDQKNPENCFNYRKEFDLLVDKIYNGTTGDAKDRLWQQIGSFLLENKHISSDPTTTLRTALIQAQEKIP